MFRTALAAAALAAQVVAAADRAIGLLRPGSRKALESLAGVRPFDGIMYGPPQNQMVRTATVASLVSVKVLLLCRISSRRTSIGVLGEVLVPTAHS